MTLFQTLDDKSECVGLYIDKELNFDLAEIPSSLSKTWRYVPYLKGKDIDYINLYLEGDSLKSVLPEYLLDDWEDISNKLLAFKRSLVTAGVSLEENCFYDLVPRRFLIEYCELQNKITLYVEKNIPQPTRYPFYKFVHILLRDLEEYDVKIDRKFISSFSTSPKLKNYASRILDGSSKIKYKQFGTKTGRLSCSRDSFPILTLPTELRGGVIPRNDYFLEIDFNGAEIRTLLGLLEKPQPSEDVHQYNMTQVFGGSLSRERAKTAFFAWLYGSRTAVTSQERSRLESFYGADKIIKKYWDGKTVTTAYGKVIPDTSKHHALNYIIQSTTAELVIKQALKIKYFLESRQAITKLVFLVHDSIVLDVKKEDVGLIKDVLALFGNTNFGKYRVNLKQGKSLGTLKRVSM
tara:strand:+ start:927 stop:2147 length:1221 start_codon:yes stop_codon:yes gene_type:complete